MLAELADALDPDFDGYGALWNRLLAAPKHGGNEREADEMGRGYSKRSRGRSRSSMCNAPGSPI